MENVPGISCHAHLSLRWQAAAPDAGMLAAARRTNLELLHALDTLESAPDNEHDANPAIAKAIERLESKLDIVIGMLSRLIAQHGALPAPAPVSLGVDRIEWQADDAPPPDTTIRIELYLSPKLPEPLQLYARVIDAPAGACMAEFLDRDEELEEWMTRTLFRYHRRELQARHHA